MVSVLEWSSSRLVVAICLTVRMANRHWQTQRLSKCTTWRAGRVVFSFRMDTKMATTNADTTHAVNDKTRQTARTECATQIAKLRRAVLQHQHVKVRKVASILQQLFFFVNCICVLIHSFAFAWWPSCVAIPFSLLFLTSIIPHRTSVINTV